MKVYGFSYDGGEWCFFTEEEYREGVASERQVHGDLPGFTPWTAEVPHEVLIQTAYDYVDANDDLKQYDNNYQFNDLRNHVGHELECVAYGPSIDKATNVAVHCVECGCTIIDYDKEDN